MKYLFTMNLMSFFCFFTRSHLIFYSLGLQSSADPAAQNWSGRLGWMSYTLQLIEHIWLRASGPNAFADNIPLLSPRAETVWQARMKSKGQKVLREGVYKAPKLGLTWFITSVMQVYWSFAAPPMKCFHFLPFAHLYPVHWQAIRPPLINGTWQEKIYQQRRSPTNYR